MEPGNGELLSFKRFVISPEKEWVIFLHGIGGDNRTFSLQLRNWDKLNFTFPALWCSSIRHEIHALLFSTCSFLHHLF